ncbi:PREDICTED: uncharacterized protein LOC105565751 [Vollenhovia emeryi]|uniref:uncharacterized protein LOC105565751 n=1 Tax=Vollenhovia emeryi TaxID=411798 RepID=UPI0005F56525|nr:PREDICTED: uncharacterized protein LOC105565751 [Vollenhovia emeryi]XP_011874584.1 PREDICTED: uncharacterized protein LOC105565751 [Vollenhovia emeryi]
MADDTATECEDKNEAATPIPFCLVEFQCKSEPLDLLEPLEPLEPSGDLTHQADEDPFDESALNVPVSIPMIKDPIVLLERCDKIWETLQLIKGQTETPTALTDDCDKDVEETKEEEEMECLDEVKQSLSSPVRMQLRRSDNTAATSAFKFSIQRTRKLYPCITCGNQYLERRSLRKHSERVHGVVLPLLIKRKHWRHMRKIKAATATSPGKEGNRSEQLHNNKDSSEETTVKTKPASASPATSSTTTTQLIKCTLCQQKVTSLRKHLISYHKIGGSSTVVKQLESSLLSETASEDGRTTDEPHQGRGRTTDNEENIHGRSQQVKRKTSYTSRHASDRKKFKSSNECDALVETPLPTVPKQASMFGSYKCNICLGMYSSTHSLYKHKRIHYRRGETRDNFHKFQCRYFNSPFNKKFKVYAEARSRMMSGNNVAKNTSSEVNEDSTLQLNDPGHDSSFQRATRYNERMKKINETTCLCGRSFRNPHTLFIHKKNCELYQYEDATTQSRVSSDRDSGIGINITIKKRNDSYEIVGKDDELEISETSNPKDSLSCTSNNTKDFIETSITRHISDIQSKYSKDHSILKLEDADEDVIIDVEDDVQVFPNKDTTKQVIATREDGKQDSSGQQNEDVKAGKTEKVYNKVTTLKQMCQKVLDVLEMCKSENVENKETSQIKDRETCDENSEERNMQGSKRELRSRYHYSRVESDHTYIRTRVETTQFNSFKCGYCREELDTIKAYDNHQCTVTRGISFDKFSLQLPCFFCKELINNYNEFDEHVRSKHFDTMHHCYHCPERFTSDKARLAHCRSEHNDLGCRFCNKKISIAGKAFHEAYHLGYGFPCHKCKKAYITNRNLYYHKQSVHSSWADDLMTCTICLKCVKFKTFRRHMAAHKHNACHFCGKKFSDRVGIEYHTMMYHGTNVKLKCNTCGTRFYTRKHLEAHEKIDGCSNSKSNVRK